MTTTNEVTMTDGELITYLRFKNGDNLRDLLESIMKRKPWKNKTASSDDTIWLLNLTRQIVTYLEEEEEAALRLKNESDIRVAIMVADQLKERTNA